MLRPVTVALLVVVTGSACGSGEDAVITSTSSVEATSSTAAAPTPTPTPPDTSPGATTVPGGQSVQVITFDELAGLLPVLAPTTDGTYTVELRERVIEVRVADGEICLVTTCAAPSGLLVHSDQAPPTPVYAVLTSSNVGVQFSSPGGGLSCFSEIASTLGPLTVSWCEDRFPPEARFTAPDGTVLTVTIG